MLAPRFGENESLGLLFDIFSQVIQDFSQPMMMKMHEEWRVFSDSIYLCSPEQSFFLRPEEHGVNLIMGLFDIWISQLFQKLVKCGVVLGRDLDADEDFADVYQRNVLVFNTSSSEKGGDAPAPWFL